MTNHVHLIVIPKNENSLARAVGETHRLYTRRINFAQKTKGHLFQERFFSTPLDDGYFINTLRYVEQNPVRAKMVKEAWEYPYSSTRYHLGITKQDALLSSNKMIESIMDYKTFLQNQPRDIETIRERTRTGRPCGEEGFYDTIQREFGRDFRPKKAGRPKVEK
jgi:putative transposase